MGGHSSVFRVASPALFGKGKWDCASLYEWEMLRQLKCSLIYGRNDIFKCQNIQFVCEVVNDICLSVMALICGSHQDDGS